MNTKNKILELLEKNRGSHLSGEVIAGVLKISRNAVWKAIKSLEQDGHVIEAVTSRGYILSNNSCVLSVQGLLPYLLNEENAEKINVFNTLESTNKTAKEMAVKGFEHGTTIIADHQTAGKGRFGRYFYSPPRSGLYMSIILRPEFIQLPNISMITSVAAVLVCKAIEAVTGQKSTIKWVNDILLNDKKVCGILTEAVTDFESSGVGWIVVGIGVNIDTKDFPTDLRPIATSLFSDNAVDPIRNRLAAEIINYFLSTGSWINNDEIYKEYRDRFIMLGSTIIVHSGKNEYEATAIDIDECCRLIVKKADGETVALSSGEVSIKNNRPLSPK